MMSWGKMYLKEAEIPGLLLLSMSQTFKTLPSGKLPPGHVLGFYTTVQFHPVRYLPLNTSYPPTTGGSHQLHGVSRQHHQRLGWQQRIIIERRSNQRGSEKSDLGQ